MDDQEAGRLLNEVAVTYSVKELLSRIEERLIRIETRAENYATQEHVERAAGDNRAQIDALAVKIDELESIRDKMLGAAFAIGAFSGGAAGWIANLLAGGG